MPNIETAWRYDTAVVWMKRDVADNYGNPTLHSPIQLSVRIEEGQSEKLGPQGEPIAASVKVVVDRRIPVGSLMWLGYLSDYDGENLKQVIDYREVPDIKGRYRRREVVLMNFSDSIPDLVTGTGS